MEISEIKPERQKPALIFWNIAREITKDNSAKSLIVANIVTMFFTIYEGWDILTLMWIYWAQNMIIGLFNFIKILTLNEFSTDGLRMNDKPVQPIRSTKISVAFFFLVHYGFFHAVYAVFLFSGFGPMQKHPSPISSIDKILIAVSIFAFFGNHLFSFFYNRQRDKDKKPNLGTVMFFPYVRIIPMHLTIIFGIFIMVLLGMFRIKSDVPVILFFLILKTIADVIMHVIEHSSHILKSSACEPNQKPGA